MRKSLRSVLGCAFCTLLLWLAPVSAAQAQTVLSQVTRAAHCTVASGMDYSRWVALDTTATTLLFSDSVSTSGLLPIGFPFLLDGDTLLQFSVSANGRLQLGGTPVSADSLPLFATASRAAAPMLAAFSAHCGIVSDSISYIKYKVTGSAPHRRLVVEAKHKPYAGLTTSERVHYQIQLCEDSSRILFVYEASTARSLVAGYQAGILFAPTDLLVLNTQHHAAAVRAADYTPTNTVWPGLGHYYEITPPSYRCPHPVAVAARTTTDSAYLSWSGAASEWLLSYSSRYSLDSSGLTTLRSTAPALAIGHLAPQTRYYYFLRAINAAHDTSRYVADSFFTQCGTSALPYRCGFEPGEASAACWTYRAAGRSATPPSSSRASSYAHSGGNALALNVRYSTAAYSWAALPPMSAAPGDLALTFFVRSSDGIGSRPLRVGYMTDVEDTAAFVLLRLLRVPSTGWSRCTVSLPDSMPADARLTFMAHNDSAGWYDYDYWIDDLTLEPPAACPAATGLTAEAAARTARLSWHIADAAGLAAPAAYTVSYAPRNAPRQRLQLSVSDTLCHLTALRPATSYLAWVSPRCDSAAYGYGDSVSFSTDTLPCLRYDSLRSVSFFDVAPHSLGIDHPFNSQVGYRAEEALFSAAEMGNAPMLITHFALCASFWSYIPRTLDVEDVDIYFANVGAALTSLSGNLVPKDSTFQLVKHGLHLSSQWWMETPLDSAFLYNGVGNLLVLFVIHTTEPTSVVFHGTTLSGMSRALTSHRPFASLAALEGGTVCPKRPDMRFLAKSCDSTVTCLAPQIFVDEVTDTSVRFSWIPGNEETSWNVYYRRADDSWSLLANDYGGTSYTLTHLLQGTPYYVAVASQCDGTPMDTVSFTTVANVTECEPIHRNEMPYRADFCPYGLNTMPACWQKLSTVNGYPRLRTRLFNSHTSYTMIFYSYADRYNYAILPTFDMSLDSLEVQCYTGINSGGTGGRASTALLLGVMDDPTDPSTFVTTDTLIATDSIEWRLCYGRLHNYTGTGHYIALRSDSTCLNYGGCFVRDLVVTQRSFCHSPRSAYANQLAGNMATVNVIDADSAAATGYLLRYGTSDQEIYATHALTFHGLRGQLSGLRPHTTYHAWLHTLCTADTSHSVSFSFTTQILCAAALQLRYQVSTVNRTALLTWSPSEEALPATAYVLQYKAATASVWNTDTTVLCRRLISNLAGNTRYLYRLTTLCSGYESDVDSGSFSTFERCNTIENNDLTTLHVPFDGLKWYGYSQSLYTADQLATTGDTLTGLYFQIAATETTGAHPYPFVLYVGNAEADSFASSSSWVSADSLTLVCSYDTLVTHRTGWQYIPFDVPFVRRHDRPLVVALHHYNGSGLGGYAIDWTATATHAPRSLYYSSATLDCDPAHPRSGNGRLWCVPDISFRAACADSGCAAPLLACTAATDHTLTLLWYPGGDETSYALSYRRIDDDAWTPLLSGTTLTEATLTGLQSGTTYAVRLAPSCGTDGARCALGYFSTLCGTAALPVVERFTTADTGTYRRPCWQTGAERSALPAVADADDAGRLLLMRQGAYLMAPDVALAPSQLQLHLDYRGSAGAALYVGTLTDISSLLTFTPVDTLWGNGGNAFVSRTVHFAGHGTLAGNLCLYAAGAETLQVDNLCIEEARPCPNVDSVWTVSATTASAQVAWQTDGAGTAASYLVEYGPSGFVRGSGTRRAATRPSLLLTGLTPATWYDLYVTPVCSTGDTMHATPVCRLLTACGSGSSLPYSMDFDTPYLPALPPCWSAERTDSSAATDGRPRLVYDDRHASSGRSCLAMSQPAVVALPPLAAPIDTLMLSLHLSTDDTACRLLVGTVDSLSPGFAASFVAFDTLGGYGGRRDTLRLCHYGGAGPYLAFRNLNSRHARDSAGVYLDDLSLRHLDGCQPVAELTASNVGDGQLTLHWSSCGTPLAYQVEYGAHGYLPDNGSRLTATGNAATLTGLSASRRYDVRVRAICAASDTSRWTSAIFATALCNGADSATLNQGNTGYASTEHFPASPRYTYSCSEVLYDSAAMRAAGFHGGDAVTGFAFCPAYQAYSNSFSHCSVLMRHVSKKVFASDIDFDTMTAADLMYSGSLNWDSRDWRRVDFAAPFVWDGHSTVALAVYRGADNTGSYCSFLANAYGTYHAVYHHSDQQAVDPYTLQGLSATGSGRSSTVPEYRLLYCPGDRCGTSYVSSIDRSFVHATLHWMGYADSVEISLKETGAGTWPAAAVTAGTSRAFSGLQPATRYAYRLRARCSGATGEWVEGTFSTLCLCRPPVWQPATATFSSALLGWTPANDETQWRLHVWGTDYDTLLLTDSPAAGVDGLQPGLCYRATVQALCGNGALLSAADDTLRFLTAICDTVKDLTAQRITDYTAAVSWSATASSLYHVEYGRTGFTLGQGELLYSSSRSLTLTGLERGTAYDVYVQAVCADLYPSQWSSPCTFRTTAGLPTAEGNTSVSLYPNPANGSTSLLISGAGGTVTLLVVDLSGRIVLSDAIACGDSCLKQIDLSPLPAGIYFVRLQGTSLNAIKKLIIK